MNHLQTKDLLDRFYLSYPEGETTVTDGDREEYEALCDELERRGAFGADDFDSYNSYYGPC